MGPGVEGCLARLDPFHPRRITRGEVASFEARPQYCRICDRAMPGSMLGAHAREAHPAAARLLRLGLAAYLGIALGLAVILTITYLLVAPRLPKEDLEALAQGLLLLGIVAWMGLALAWARFVTLPALAKARARWQAAHPSSQGSQGPSNMGWGFRP